MQTRPRLFYQNLKLQPLKRFSTTSMSGIVTSGNHIVVQSIVEAGMPHLKTATHIGVPSHLLTLDDFMLTISPKYACFPFYIARYIYTCKLKRQSIKGWGQDLYAFDFSGRWVKDTYSPWGRNSDHRALSQLLCVQPHFIVDHNFCTSKIHH